MNIKELNAKLVSDLREIARLIGIADADKMRKQELIDKIVATEKDAKVVDVEEVTDNPANAPAPEERPRKRARTTKPVEPVSFRKRAELPEVDVDTKMNAN